MEKNVHYEELAATIRKKLDLLFKDRFVWDFQAALSEDVEWATSDLAIGAARLSWAYQDGTGYLVSQRREIAHLIDTLNVLQGNGKILRGDHYMPDWYLENCPEPLLPGSTLSKDQNIPLT